MEGAGEGVEAAAGAAGVEADPPPWKNLLTSIFFFSFLAGAAAGASAAVAAGVSAALGAAEAAAAGNDIFSNPP